MGLVVDGWLTPTSLTVAVTVAVIVEVVVVVMADFAILHCLGSFEIPALFQSDFVVFASVFVSVFVAVVEIVMWLQPPQPD